MKKTLYTIVSLFFLLQSTSAASAYTYKSTSGHGSTGSYNKYNSNTYGNYNFYKKSTSRGHYASTASPYRNPHPRNIKERHLQMLAESVYYIDRAPTGNYPRRAFMANK